ncbi:hypothetical protein K458DRAFT_140441 [Lentithecium fluviatile CBS 122367]|uniref:Uncharacterized protein n=1 Tax=Lentithecium fluviatile CBS 122367 TaxID=1168545 RepID=A0A6G1IJB0_9PLEO|nr:hypothetical protein K458DRAFT_140441 [Lentithecium fluviatile CBS 122367]
MCESSIIAIIPFALATTVNAPTHRSHTPFGRPRYQYGSKSLKTQQKVYPAAHLNAEGLHQRPIRSGMAERLGIPMAEHTTAARTNQMDTEESSEPEATFILHPSHIHTLRIMQIYKRGRSPRCRDLSHRKD